ncbi:LysR family transcriptional regulator [Lewinella cohaerens]|uniref:LysR family transcriptional regulator n=1 Tax=Lewinella cohaerens TaxID=70995 RepID=UPI00036A9F99|nr:LysR family transcriptional regulator [Lewinella cohaerens]
MNYTLHQLRIFREIVKTRSVTKASKALHLSQPAVSIQLKKLQDQFEIPLTEVIGRQIYITEFGEEVAEACDRILDEVYSLKHRTLAYKGFLTGQLKISVVSTAKYVMPYFLPEFLGRNEGIDIVMDVTNKASVVQSLRENEVDFAMVSVMPTDLALNSIELMSNKLYLVGSASRVGKLKKIDKEVLKTSLLIYREEGSATRQQMEEFLTENELPVTKRMELTSNEAVKQAVIAGLGYSVLPLIGIKNEIANGSIHVIPFKGLPMVTSWSLVWLKNKKFSPAGAAFLQFLRDEKETIILDKFQWFEDFKS